MTHQIVVSIVVINQNLVMIYHSLPSESFRGMTTTKASSYRIRQICIDNYRICAHTNFLPLHNYIAVSVLVVVLTNPLFWEQSWIMMYHGYCVLRLQYCHLYVHAEGYFCCHCRFNSGQKLISFLDLTFVASLDHITCML